MGGQKSVRKTHLDFFSFLLVGVQFVKARHLDFEENSVYSLWVQEKKTTEAINTSQPVSYNHDASNYIMPNALDSSTCRFSCDTSDFYKDRGEHSSSFPCRQTSLLYVQARLILFSCFHQRISKGRGSFENSWRKSENRRIPS